MIRSVIPVYVIASLILFFLCWASFFEINETVRAEAKVIPRGRIQVVQIADGGVLAELLVNEGEAVKQGQVLATLENVRASARHNELDAKILAYKVARARAEAELKGISPDFSEFLGVSEDVVSAQQRLYVERSLRQKQLIESLRKTVVLAQSEFDLINRLKKAGDVNNLRFLEAQESLIENKQALDDARAKYRSEVLSEIAEIDREIYSLEYSILERENILDKTRIVSPKQGVVSNLRFNTIGAKISSGEELLSISPTDEVFELEIQIPLADVGVLRRGLPIIAKLSAFDATVYGDLKGELKLIGANVSTQRDPSGDEMFYKGSAIIDWDSNPRIDVKLIRPGMTATVDIITGKRTVLKYLLKPLLRGFSGVMTER